MDTEILATIWADLDRLKQKPTIKPVDNRLCIYCSGTKILTREGLVCSECGVVDSIYIDDTEEWKTCVTDDVRINDQARCTVPVENQ